MTTGDLWISDRSGASLFIEARFGDRALATGTGFVALAGQTPCLITNRHNVTGRHQETGEPLSSTAGIPDRLGIAHSRWGQPGAWTVKFEQLFDSGRPRWIEHPVLGPRADIVALPLTELQDVDVLPYDPSNPGPEMALGPATSLSIIGFPFGITGGGAFPVWITGAVASEPGLDWGGLPVFLVDARTRPGQSGSPVISYFASGTTPIQGGVAFGAGPSWRFHGVYSGRIRSDSDLGMVWKTQAVAELLEAVT